MFGLSSWLPSVGTIGIFLMIGSIDSSNQRSHSHSELASVPSSTKSPGKQQKRASGTVFTAANAQRRA